MVCPMIQDCFPVVISTSIWNGICPSPLTYPKIPSLTPPTPSVLPHWPWPYLWTMKTVFRFTKGSLFWSPASSLPPQLYSASSAGASLPLPQPQSVHPFLQLFSSFRPTVPPDFQLQIKAISLCRFCLHQASFPNPPQVWYHSDWLWYTAAQ